MGDSNIARIPKFKLNGIQADSYPGATLRHLTAILLRLTSPRLDTKLILFSRPGGSVNDIKKPQNIRKFVSATNKSGLVRQHQIWENFLEPPSKSLGQDFII
jgi:hypothetical protein